MTIQMRADLPREMDFAIVPERADHEAGREWLLDRVIGPIRFRRACERLREGRRAALAFIAEREGASVGTVRLWSVSASGLEGAVLLGPLAVDSSVQSCGIGAALMTHSIAAAAAAGHRSVILVGDPEYYARFGFSAAPAAALAVPGPFERHRLLALALVDGALDGARGTLRASGLRVGNVADTAALARVA